MYNLFVQFIGTFYCSSIWSPYSDCYIKALESVQKRFLRFLSRKMRQPMAFNDHSYSRISRELNIFTIESTHRFYDFVFVWRIKNSKINCSELVKLFESRSLPHNIRNVRSIGEIKSTQDYVFYSIIPRLKRLWNSLNSDLRSIK